MDVQYWRDKYFNEMLDDITDQADFISNEDELDRYVNEYLYNIGIYDYEAKEIVENLKYDIFDIDNYYLHRPDNWQEAARFAIHELWLDSNFDYTDLCNYKSNTKRD